MRARLILVIVAGAVLASVAWFAFRDSGVVVAIGIAGIYAGLISADLPLDRWTRLSDVRKLVSDSTPYEVLVKPACGSCAGVHRHVHFGEVLECARTERAARAYGAQKICEKLIRDVRHDWERSVFLAIVLLAVWGILAFGRIGSQPAGGKQPTEILVAPAFDYWKAGITSVLGFFRLAAQADILHWFRKRNAET